MFAGAFLACAAAVALGEVARRGGRWSWVVLACTTGGLLVTLTRGAYVAFAVALLAALVLAARRRGPALRRVLGVAIVLIGALLVVLAAQPTIIARLTSDEAAGSIRQRARTFEIVFDAVRASPLLGHGGGTSALAVGDPIQSLRYIENGYLQLLLSTGIGGLILVVALLVALGVTAARKDPRAALLVVAVVVVLASYNAEDQAATAVLLGLTLPAAGGGAGAAPPPAPLVRTTAAREPARQVPLRSLREVASR